MITDDYLKGEINDFKINNLIGTMMNQYHEQMIRIIYLTTTFDRFIFINQRTSYGKAIFNEREKSLIPHMPFNPDNLTQNQVELYEKYWTMMNNNEQKSLI